MHQLKPYIDSENEKELASRIANGERIAFEILFNKYYKSLYVLAMKYLKDPVLSEDAIQEIFLKIWLNRSSINPDASLKGYLHTITKNYILNSLRNNAVVTKRIIEYTRINSNPVNPNIAESDFSIGMVYKAIESLPKKRRIITKLKLYKGLDNQSIAKKLKLSVNTVKFQYGLALKQIRGSEKK